MVAILVSFVYLMDMAQLAKENVDGAPPVFEQGPIRPPSEARSLLLRVTRNCPWNQCEFCPVYKGQKFSLRAVAEVKADVAALAFWTEAAVAESWRLGFGGRLDAASIPAVHQRNADNPYLTAVLVWMSGGGRTAFLQDANNLIARPGDLAQMIRFLRETFPGIKRVTSYARSQTLAKRSLEDLKLVKEAGLDRVHVGLESGADSVLKLVKKGATAQMQIEGGQKAKAAGLELSEYVMPGLGGRERWEEHAQETARVLNEIDPHFIRLRSLGLREGMPLWERTRAGEFQLMNDVEIARELRLFIESLSGIRSFLVSDHILNLLPELEGRIPEDQEKMISVIDRFLELGEDDRLTYIVGRRFGLFESLADLADPVQALAARRALERLKDHGDNLHETIREIVSRFI